MYAWVLLTELQSLHCEFAPQGLGCLPEWQAASTLCINCDFSHPPPSSHCCVAWLWCFRTGGLQPCAAKRFHWEGALWHLHSHQAALAQCWAAALQGGSKLCAGHNSESPELWARTIWNTLENMYCISHHIFVFFVLHVEDHCLVEFVCLVSPCFYYVTFVSCWVVNSFL